MGVGSCCFGCGVCFGVRGNGTNGTALQPVAFMGILVTLVIVYFAARARGGLITKKQVRAAPTTMDY